MLSAGRFAYALPPFPALYFLGVLVDFTNLQPHGESEKQCNRNFINFAAHTLSASLRFPSLSLSTSAKRSLSIRICRWGKLPKKVCVFYSQHAAGNREGGMRG